MRSLSTVTVNGNHFASSTNLRTSSATGRNDSVSQAPCTAVQHDVFDRADFITLGRLNFLPNELARLNVTGAATGGALGLGER
jgi:hypothetical protein